MASLLHCHQQTVQRLLSEAITVLCQNSLPFRDQLCVQGLLGITLDNRDVLLVDIHERVARSGGYDSWEPHSHQSQDDRHETVSDRYATPPTGKQQQQQQQLTEEGVSSLHAAAVVAAARNNQIYTQHVAARLQQQQQDPPSIAFLSKMYERQMGAFKTDPYAGSKQSAESSPPPRLTSPREPLREPRGVMKMHDYERERERERHGRERLSGLSEPPTLEAEERSAEVERRCHDNNSNNNNKGHPEREEGKQSEGHPMLNGHSSPPALSDCPSPLQGPHPPQLRSPSAVNLSNNNNNNSQTDVMISHSTAPGSSNPPTDGSTISSSKSDSCLLHKTHDYRDPPSRNNGAPCGTRSSSSTPTPFGSSSNNPSSISPAAVVIAPHRSPAGSPAHGDQAPSAATPPQGCTRDNHAPDSPGRESRDSISLTVSKIFAHRFEGQPPLKKRLTEIAEQQDAEDREKDRKPEEEDLDSEAVNYTVCHSVRGKLRGSQKRKARVSYPLDLSKVGQYEEEDQEEEDLAEWGVTPDKEPSGEDENLQGQNTQSQHHHHHQSHRDQWDQRDPRDSRDQRDHPRDHPRCSPNGSEHPHQESPPHSDAGSIHQRAAAYDEQQQQHHQQRMMMKSSNHSEDQLSPQQQQQQQQVNHVNSMSNQSSQQQHNSVAFPPSLGQQRGSHLLPPHLPVSMFDGSPLVGAGGDMGLSLMINNLVNAYGPGLPLPGLGGKPTDLSPVGYHSGKPPNLNLGNLGSMSLGSGSPQHSPHLLSPSPAHVGSPHGFGNSGGNLGNPGTPTSGDERGHKCSQCGKLVASLQGLMIHYRTHTGEKPHVCGMCGKGLSTVQGLQVHQRTHTGEKPYICTTCGKGFNDKSNMKRHIRHCTLRAPTRFLLSNPLHHMSHS